MLLRWLPSSRYRALPSSWYSTQSQLSKMVALTLGTRQNERNSASGTAWSIPERAVFAVQPSRKHLMPVAPTMAMQITRRGVSPFTSSQALKLEPTVVKGVHPDGSTNDDQSTRAQRNASRTQSVYEDGILAS